MSLPLPVLMRVVRLARLELDRFPYDPHVLAADAQGNPCGAGLPCVSRLSLRGAIHRAAAALFWAEQNPKPDRPKPGNPPASPIPFVWSVLQEIDDFGCLPRREPRTKEQARRWLDLCEEAIVRTHAQEHGVRLAEIATRDEMVRLEPMVRLEDA